MQKSFKVVVSIGWDHSSCITKRKFVSNQPLTGQLAFFFLSLYACGILWEFYEIIHIYFSQYLKWVYIHFIQLLQHNFFLSTSRVRHFHYWVRGLVWISVLSNFILDDALHFPDKHMDDHLIWLSGFSLLENKYVGPLHHGFY